MMLGKRWCWVGMGMRLLNYWWFRWDMNTNSLVRDLNGCHKLPLAELAKKYRDLTRSSVHILLHSTPCRGIPSLVATVIWHWTLSSTALINLICTSRITNDYCTEIHSQDICTSCITNEYCIAEFHPSSAESALASAMTMWRKLEEKVKNVRTALHKWILYPEFHPQFASCESVLFNTISFLLG